MDHELKQRIIGAVVITALAAIFIPMLFDDPVDTRGKEVATLTIPPKPTENSTETNLPADKSAVLESKESDLAVSEGDEVGQDNSGVEDSMVAESAADSVKQPVVDESEPENVAPKTSSHLDDKSAVAKQSQKPVADSGVRSESEDQPGLPEPADSDPTEHEQPTTAIVEAPHAVKEKPKSIATKAKNNETHNKVIEKTPKKEAKLKRYSIQAGSFSKKENAQALVDKLRKQGLPASMSSSGDMYRVKIGPELDKAKATEMKAKLDKQKIKGLLVSE